MKRKENFEEGQRPVGDLTRGGFPGAAAGVGAASARRRASANL